MGGTLASSLDDLDMTGASWDEPIGATRPDRVDLVRAGKSYWLGRWHAVTTRTAAQSPGAVPLTETGPGGDVLPDGASGVRFSAAEWLPEPGSRQVRGRS